MTRCKTCPAGKDKKSAAGVPSGAVTPQIHYNSLLMQSVISDMSLKCDKETNIHKLVILWSISLLKRYFKKAYASKG